MPIRHPLGSDWRFIGRSVDIKKSQVRWEKEIYISGTIDEIIRQLESYKTEYADVSDLHLSMEFEYGSYGDRDRDYVMLRGWTAPSDSQMESAMAEVRARENAAKEYHDNIERELRKSRPELFR